MSVNNKIESAVAPIISDIWPLVCPDDVPPEEYVVYNPELEEASLYGDDTDLEWVHHMQVHYFTRKNYLGNRQKIRQALKDIGFCVTDITTLYEKDTGYYHLIFSCWIEEEE